MIQTIYSNSEFIIILNKISTDLKKMAKLL